MTASANQADSGTSLGAFLALLLVAFLMGANHVAARFAFNDGVSVPTAVFVRSAVTSLVVSLIVYLHRVPLTFTKRQRSRLPLIGFLIGCQSLALYASVARIPVALALLAFNTYPLATAFWDYLLYRNKPQRAVLIAIPVLLLGLALALDVFAAASGISMSSHWAKIGVGVAFGLLASAIFGLALVLTQHEAQGVDGRVRTVTTLSGAAIVAALAIGIQGGPALPQHTSGWMGLLALSALYGTAFTIMFTVLPKVGVAGNTAIMNAEPIFALGLAWALLNQSVAPIQLLGALIVVGTVLWLGLHKK